MIAIPRIAIPRIVAIERALHIVLNPRLDIAELVADRVFQCNLRHDLTHRAFSDLADGIFGGAQLEQIFLGILDAPADLVSDVDDVLVAGKHQCFRRRRAELDIADLLDIDLLHPLDRVRQREADSRREGRIIAAEHRHHAAFLGRDLVGGGNQQKHRQHAEHDPHVSLIPLGPRGAPSSPNPPPKRRRLRSMKASSPAEPKLLSGRVVGRCPPHGPGDGSRGGSPAPLSDFGPHGPLLSLNRRDGSEPNPDKILMTPL